jgi:hypothetical protein
MQRFGLVNADADDLGPFVTNTADWKPGDRIYRSSECDLIVLRSSRTKCGLLRTR